MFRARTASLPSHSFTHLSNTQASAAWESRLGVAATQEPHSDLASLSISLLPVAQDGNFRETENLFRLPGGKEVNETEHLLGS